MRLGLGDLVDRLGIVNQKIWHLENEIRHMREMKLPLAEIGRRALLIRDLNKERVAYKNAIDEISEEFFGDLKVDHTSAFRANNFYNNPENIEVANKLSKENLSLLKVSPKKTTKNPTAVIKKP